MEVRPIWELDKNMAIHTPKDENGIRWYRPWEAPFTLEGFAFFESEHALCRLPRDICETLEATGRTEVSELATQPAGGRVRFRSTTGHVYVRASLPAPSDFDHMTPLAQCGFDLYLRRSSDTDWHLAGVTRFDRSKAEYTATVWQGGDGEDKEFLLHFPLYRAVNEVWIGLDDGAALTAAAPRAHALPLAIYGTSIDQGGCATRPGLITGNRLARRLDVNVLNFGFSGNAIYDLPVAEAISRLPALGGLIVNAEANNVGERPTTPRLQEFLQIIRRAWPQIPILVLSNPSFSRETFSTEIHERHLRVEALEREIVAERIAAGDTHITFVTGSELWRGHSAAELEEATVDGTHLNDMGFALQAESMARYISGWLND